MPSVWRFLGAIVIGPGLALRSYRKKSLSWDGAINAAVTGFFHFLVGVSPTVLLLAFFFSSSRLTKYKADIKRKIEEEYKEGGQRNWKQVFVNSGLELVVCWLYLYWFGDVEHPINFNTHYWPSYLISLIIGGYSCSNGDTWASELGVTSEGSVWLITTGQRVPKGTNGGISVFGTAASVGGGFLIGAMHYLCTFFVSDNFDVAIRTQWPSILLGTFAGFTGAMMDSFLGATLEYSGFDEKKNMVVSKKAENVKHISGRDILKGNHVNFLSIIITAFLSAWVAPHFYKLATK